MILAVAVLSAGVFMLMWAIIEISDRWFTRTFAEYSLEKRLQANEDDPDFMDFIANKVRDEYPHQADD
jgi:hypothetical protein